MTDPVEAPPPRNSIFARLPGDRRLWALLALVVYFGLVVCIFDSLAVRADVAKHGADMNWTFDRHHREPEALAREARHHGTVCVTGWDKAIPAEGRGREAGYIVVMQLLGLAGVDLTYKTLAQFHVLVFLLNSLLFSAVLGLAARRIFPVSFIVLSLLFVFRHYNATVIYYMLGPWTLVTSLPLLAFTAILFLRASLGKSWVKAILACLAVGAVAGAIRFLREGQAYAFLGACLGFVLLLWILRRTRWWVAGLAGLVLVGAFWITSPLIRQAVVHHRAAHTDLEPRQYSGGMYHGHWYVLLYSIGRYENPYGYYSSDYFVIDTVNAILQQEGRLEKTHYASEEYQEAAKDYYFRQIWQHPGYYAYYLGRSFLDYTMFIPYGLFLHRSSRTPVGAHVPVIRDDVEYNLWDFVWRDRLGPDGTATMDRSCLKNLKPRYFYLRGSHWLLFGICLLFFAAGPFVGARILPKEISLGLIGMYVAFGFYSLLRIPIPMHGWGVILGFWALFAVNLALLADHFLGRASARTPADLRKWLRRVGWGAALIALVVLSLLRASGVRLAQTRSRMPVQPRIVKENVEGFDVVQYGGKIYGVPLGYWPNYEDPAWPTGGNVHQAESVEAVEEMIRRWGRGGRPGPER